MKITRLLYLISFFAPVAFLCGYILGAPRYQIPHGGVWEYSTSAQYFVELWAWFGWMAVTGFGPNGAFIFFVSCFNLIPRAVSNDLWYREKFGAEFQALGRAKLVPFVW